MTPWVCRHPPPPCALKAAAGNRGRGISNYVSCLMFALGLSARVPCGVPQPRVPLATLALPWARVLLGFQPACRAGSHNPGCRSLRSLCPGLGSCWAFSPDMLTLCGYPPCGMLNHVVSLERRVVDKSECNAICMFYMLGVTCSPRRGKRNLAQGK